MSRNVGNGRINRRGRASAGKVIAGRFRREVDPPVVIPAGKLRCPVCRNFASPTPNGNLRRHKDLFGFDCWNRTPERTEDREPVEAPPVKLPPPPPGRTGPRERNTPEPPPVVLTGNSRPITGRCFECGKPLPPMRRLCGKCMSKRRGS